MGPDEISTHVTHDHPTLAPAAAKPLKREVLAELNIPLGWAELVEYHVPHGGRFVVEERHHVLEMLLTEHPVPRMARFQHMSTARPMGEVHFAPADHRLEIDWPASDNLRGIRCSFRKELVQPPRIWAVEELVAALDVGIAPVRRALQSLAEEVMAPGFNASLLIDSLSVVVAVELGRFLRRRLVTSPPGQLSAAQLALVNERIETHGALPTAAELARECHLSRRHFFRLFRQTTGMSLADYANHRRIDRAKTLLRQDGLVVKQVAYQCGFQTPSAFSAAFRRTTGLTPKEYRHSARPGTDTQPKRAH